jgi:hypothetical protein
VVSLFSSSLGSLFYVCISTLLHRVLSTTLRHGRIILYSLGLKSNFLFEAYVENWFLLYAAPWHSWVMLLNALPGCRSSVDSLLTISCLLLGEIDGTDVCRHHPISSPQEVHTARNTLSYIKSIAWGHIDSKLQNHDSNKGLLT